MPRQPRNPNGRASAVREGARFQQFRNERKAEQRKEANAAANRLTQRIMAHESNRAVQTYRQEIDASKARRATVHEQQMAEAKAMWDRLQAQDEIRTRGGRRRRAFHVGSRDPLEIELPSFRSTTGA